MTSTINKHDMEDRATTDDKEAKQHLKNMTPIFSNIIDPLPDY